MAFASDLPQRGGLFLRRFSLLQMVEAFALREKQKISRRGFEGPTWRWAVRGALRCLSLERPLEGSLWKVLRNELRKAEFLPSSRFRGAQGPQSVRPAHAAGSITNARFPRTHSASGRSSLPCSAQARVSQSHASSLGTWIARLSSNLSSPSGSRKIMALLII